MQAVDDPPINIIPTEHGEMVVSRLAEEALISSPATQVVGSSHTVQLCTTHAAIDPLQENDPWSLAVKQGVSMPAKQALLDPVEQLEMKVVDSVVTKINQDGLMTSQMQARVDALEQKVQDLAEGQNRVQSTVQEQGRAHQAQIAQLHQQGQQLESAIQEQAGQLGNFQQQFRAQLEQQQGHLDSLFQTQLSKIEDLIGGPKKARRESPGPH